MTRATLTSGQCPLSLLYWSQTRASFSSRPVPREQDIEHRVPLAPHSSQNLWSAVSLCFYCSSMACVIFLLIPKPLTDQHWTCESEICRCTEASGKHGFISSLCSERLPSAPCSLWISLPLMLFSSISPFPSLMYSKATY